MELAKRQTINRIFVESLALENARIGRDNGRDKIVRGCKYPLILSPTMSCNHVILQNSVVCSVLFQVFLFVVPAPCYQ